jgi:hypothetical protein
MEQCPECGGDIIDGVCEKCGYEKDEEESTEEAE